MARETLSDVLAFNFSLLSGQWGAAQLADDTLYVLTPKAHIAQYIQTSAPTVIRLPSADVGKFFLISNTGSSTLDVQTPAGVSIFTLASGESNIAHTEGGTWRKLFAPLSAVLSVFGPEGPGAHDGLVPSPGAAQAQLRFLGSDAQWHGAFGDTLLDGFSFITDGTNTANATGNDTFRLRSSSGKITITVTDNQAVFGDNANFDVNEANVNHDALLNFVANKHIDHTAVSISAGSGLTGGGTIAANRTLSLDINGLGVVAPAVGDFIPFWDISGTINGKMTITSLSTVIDHNTLLNFVANKHIDHSLVSISTSAGLTGGGDITATRTLGLDFNALSTQAEAMASGDVFAFWDLSGTVHKKITFANLNAAWDHNTLINFVANKHIDHSAVTITGTGALTGGGDLTASRTLDIAAGGVGASQLAANQKIVGLSYVIDGGGSVITTGLKKGLYIPFACTITGWNIGLDQSGSIVIDIWKDTEANYPPTIADTITAAAKPTVTTATHAASTTLTGWTTAVAAGSWLFFNVDSVTSAQWANITLTATKT